MNRLRALFEFNVEPNPEDPGSVVVTFGFGWVAVVALLLTLIVRVRV